MTDIIIRTSDGRVQQAADSITAGADRYYVQSEGQPLAEEPFNSFDFGTTLVTNCKNVPDDVIGGWNYDYVGGRFVDTGEHPAPPEDPEPTPA